MAKVEKNRGYQIGILLLYSSTFLLTLILTYRYAQVPGGDIEDHAGFCTDWATLFDLEKSQATYPLWHLLTLILHQIFRLPLAWAAGASCAIYNLLSVVVVKKITDLYFPEGKSLLVAFIGFILFFIGPMYWPWFNPNYYLGQNTPNPWHNPTIYAVKPFALYAGYLTVKYFGLQEGEKAKRNKILLFLSITVFLSVFAKPSFLLIYLPALGVYGLIKWLSRQKKFMDLFLLGIALLPSLIAVLWQFLSLYTGPSEPGEGGITIAPLDVWGHYTPNVWISIVLCLAFPVYMAVILYREYQKDELWKFSMALLLSGLLQALLLAENGERRYHGNFDWGYMLGMAAIFVLSVIWFFRYLLDSRGKRSRADRVKLWIGAFLLYFHTFWGFCYYWKCMVIDSSFRS